MQLILGGYLSPKSFLSRIKRFFGISSSLPVELRMLLANRSCGLAVNFVDGNWICDLMNAMFVKSDSLIF